MTRVGKYPRGIDKRGSKYRARVFYMGRQHSLGGFYSLADAKTALAVARGQMAAGTFVPPSERRRLLKVQSEEERVHALTVRAWADVWMEGLERADRSPATLRSYRSTLDRHILPALGDSRLVDVTPEDVQDMVEAADVAKATRDNITRVTRAMFLSAVNAKAGGLTESPVRVVVRKPQTRTLSADDDAIPSPAEVAQLAAAMPARLGLAVLLAAWVGLREGEVLGLQRRDFAHLDDPEHATVRIQRQWASKAKPPRYMPPKTARRFPLTIPASMVPAIVAHLKDHVRPEADAPVFAARTGTPVPDTTFRTAWNKARAQIHPGLHFHDLRHVGLTRYAQQGASLAELQARGGHSTVEAAMRYQHAEAERDRALTARLDSLIEDPRQPR